MHIPQTEVILRHDGAELARHILPPGEYVIGRSREAEIHVETPRLSRRHAQLTINYDHILIEDLGSANGTFLADQPVTAASRVFPNQHVRLGPDITLEIRRQRAPTVPGVSLAPAQAIARRVLPDELLTEKRYAIGNQVAQGGMGAILDARQTAMQRRVAMKVMLDSADERDVLRFIEEAQVTGQLDHPNIVPIYELGIDEQDQLFYTMKFVRGITLKKVLELLAEGVAETVKKYPLPALLTIFQKACDAIAFAHSKGVLHRDLKPENLMLGDFGEVFVMDWGLAKVIGTRDASAREMTRSIVASARASQASHTMAGAIMGTPQYMSPEQARGEVETLDVRSDIYALGAILYHMLALRAPVTGQTAMEIVEKVARGEIEPLTAHMSPNGRRNAPRLPDSLISVVRKAMALEKKSRYAGVAELQKDVGAYQAGFATGAEKAGAWKLVKLLIRRNKAASIGVAAVFIVGSILGTGVILQGRRAEHALSDLRGTAPVFHAQALALRDDGRFEEALAKLSYALQLAPEEAHYHRLRGELLQTQLRLTEATGAFRESLRRAPEQPEVQANLALSEKLLRENPSGTITRESLRELHAAFLAQRRSAEALALAKHGLGRDELLRSYQDKIAAAYGEELRQKLSMTADDALTFSAAFNQTIADLRPLRGIPISDLNLAKTAITDLAGLEGMPLKRVNLLDTKIRDFEPLRGAPIVELDANSTEVSDLTPLTGMRLEKLKLSSAVKVWDLSPLRGMPLRELYLEFTSVTDFTALRGMPLETLVVPSDTTSNAMENLRGSRLTFLELSHSMATDLAPLRGLKLEAVIVAYSAFTDISALRGMPLKSVGIQGCTMLTDVSPLADCRELRELDASRSGVTSVESLRGLALKRLRIDETPVIDLSPLLDMPALEAAMVPRAAQNLNVLRQHPSLKYLGWEGDGPEFTVAEFWTRYDALRK